MILFLRYIVNYCTFKMVSNVSALSFSISILI